MSEFSSVEFKSHWHNLIDILVLDMGSSSAALRDLSHGILKNVQVYDFDCYFVGFIARH